LKTKLRNKNPDIVPSQIIDSKMSQEHKTSYNVGTSTSWISIENNIEIQGGTNVHYKDTLIESLVAIIIPNSKKSLMIVFSMPILLSL